MSDAWKIIFGVLFLFIISLFIMKTLVWGLLIFLAAVSVLHGLAEWINTFNEQKQKGTRLFIWFMNHKFLLEILDTILGYLAGGTGTITGITFAITTGLVASIYRIINHKWKEYYGFTLIEHIYKTKLPKTWSSEESLTNIIFDFKQKQKKENKNEPTNNQSRSI